MNIPWPSEKIERLAHFTGLGILVLSLIFGDGLRAVAINLLTYYLCYYGLSGFYLIVNRIIEFNYHGEQSKTFKNMLKALMWVFLFAGILMSFSNLFTAISSLDFEDMNSFFFSIGICLGSLQTIKHKEKF